MLLRKSHLKRRRKALDVSIDVAIQFVERQEDARMTVQSRHCLVTGEGDPVWHRLALPHGQL